MIRIGITLGDPAGIGPEIVAKALACDRLREAATMVAMGPAAVLAKYFPSGLPSGAETVDAGEIDLARLRPGVIQRECGAAALAAVRAGVAFCRRGELDALVTGPLHKQAAKLAGMREPGHTELIAALCGVPEEEVRMLLAGERLRVIHVSTHLALREALGKVTAPRVLRTIELGAAAVASLGFPRPRIAVAGLNPHAGEQGLFGDEDTREIAPAVQQARAQGFDVSGPLAPDTVFLRALQGEFDLVAAMYHDQGHIPMKVAEFDNAVNVTVGLPIVRTSVDHGTAFDIAGRGVARADNMVRAIEMAIALLRPRNGREEKRNIPE